MNHTYRVVKVQTIGVEEATETVIWQGTDIDELSEMYPPSEIWGADDLGHHSIEDGYIHWHHRFECQNSDTTWSECDDPRHRVESPEFLALERAIDKENRHFFPGDYMEEDDDSDYYDDDEWM